MKFVETYQSKCKIKIRKRKIWHISSKHVFMSKIPIVARRRRSQLATTVPVLDAGGKPSTWFPPGGCRAKWCSPAPSFCAFFLFLRLFCYASNSYLRLCLRLLLCVPPNVSFLSRLVVLLLSFLVVSRAICMIKQRFNSNFNSIMHLWTIRINLVISQKFQNLTSNLTAVSKLCGGFCRLCAYYF